MRIREGDELAAKIAETITGVVNRETAAVEAASDDVRALLEQREIERRRNVELVAGLEATIAQLSVAVEDSTRKARR